jgi:lycopene cyclase domain-containing protein
VYKKLFSPYPAGLPGYFMALVAGSTVPSMALFPAARTFINWRALSLTLFMILLISLFWEATLAVPYGWWGFRPQQMVGIFIGAWDGLPIEEVVVWISVTYTTVIVYEVLKMRMRRG